MNSTTLGRRPVVSRTVPLAIRNLNFFAKEIQRGCFRLAILTALLFGAAGLVRANVYSWSGGGLDGYWSDSANWGFAGVPNNGDSLVFPAPSSLVSTTNNLAGLTLAQIKFAGDGGGYTLYGNAFTLTVGIEATNTIGGNIINNGITLGANVQVEVADDAYLTLAGLLQGSGGVTKIGYGTLTYTYAENNTYSGTTAVNAGLLQLNVNGVNAFAGPLVIGDGSGSGSPIARLLQNSELPDGEPVTVNLGGLFDLNDFSDTIGALTIQGATVSSEGGTLALNGDVTVPGASVESMITGNLHFNGGLHFVNVAQGSFFRSLDIFANVSDSGGGLMFTNSAPSGAFVPLDGNNDISGPVIINNLTLSADTPTALGTTNAAATVGGSGTLFVYSTTITNKTLTLDGGAILYGQDNCGWTGPIVLQGNVTVDVYPASAAFTWLGVVSGPGGFEKTDVGTLQLFGAAGNTYSGNTFIQAGTCQLDKSVGTSIPGGTLTIGDQYASTALVQDVNVGGNLGSTVALNINEEGLLDLNNRGEAVGPITFTGGSITTESGYLEMGGDILAEPATNSAMISGTAYFTGGLRTVTVDAGPAPGGYDLVIPATLGDFGAGFQAVNGTTGRGDLLLTGSNSFTGPLTISGDINVSVQTPWGLGATNSGVLVTNGGTLFIFDTAITNKSVTLTTGAELAGQWGGVDPAWDGPIVLNGDAIIYGFNYLGLFDVQGAISGTGNLTVASDGEPVRFSGPLANTYTGTTTVEKSFDLDSGTTLVLDRSGDGYAIPGPLVITTNCVVEDDLDYQINSPFKPVTIAESSSLELNNNDDWIGTLTLQGAQVTTGTGLLYLGGDITVNSSAVAESEITGNATLWNGTRTINCPGHNFSPDLIITANLGGNETSGLIKTGPGEASLAGSDNTFPGPVTVNGGTLWVAATNALGNTNTLATVTNTGSLFMYGNVFTGAKPLVLAGTGSGQGELIAGFGTNTWAGSIMLASNVLVDVYTNDTLELSGSIGGTGGLAKQDWGNLLLDGTSANTFTGPTVVEQGLMTLNKNHGPATPGPLTIGLGLDNLAQDMVIALQSFQLATNGAVSISTSGLLNVGGQFCTNTAVGSLNGYGYVLNQNNIFTVGYDNTSTNYNGLINGSASGSLYKVGSGAWTLNGGGALAGLLQVQGGELYMNGSMPAVTASCLNGALLGGTGTVGPIGLSLGTLAPGDNGPGVFSIHGGGLGLNNSDTFLAAIDGNTAGSGYSQLTIMSGSVGLGNASLQLNMPVAGATNSQYTIINNGSGQAISGTFNNLPEGAILTAANGAEFKITYHGGTGESVVLTQLTLPTPPVFNGVANLGGGMIQLDGLGGSNLTYTVMTTTNLATTNWMTIGTATANGVGAIQFTDTSATNAMRFYRFSLP